MAKKDSLVRAVILVALLLLPMRAAAQIIETPMAFDSLGRIRTLSPGLVTRLLLMPPVWPIQGDFVQARVFQSSVGGVVLVAERRDGTIERHALSDAQLQALRSAIETAMTAIGARVGEERTDMISEPARGAFLRNQMILAAALYGPLIASLSEDGKAGTAMYLIAVGGSYFALSNISKTTAVTRAQNDLATDGAVRGAATAAGLMATFGGDDIDRKAYSAIALTGAVAGSAIGYVRGRGLTDSEAHAAMKFSTFAGVTAFGIAGAAGLFDDVEDVERVVAGAVVASGVAGYLFGPRYPRRARYSVTQGDVRVLPIGALLGVAIGVTPFVENDDATLPAAAGTIGGWLGVLAADRAWVRPYDFGSGDVTEVWLGTIAGALLGGSVAVLTDAQGVAGVGMVSLGGLLGAAGGHSIASPPRAGSRRALRGPADLPLRKGTRLRIDPTALGLAAARVPGPHPLVSFQF